MLLHWRLRSCFIVADTREALADYFAQLRIIASHHGTRIHPLLPRYDALPRYSVYDLTPTLSYDSLEHVDQMRPRSRRCCRPWDYLWPPPRPQATLALTRTGPPRVWDCWGTKSTVSRVSSVWTRVPRDVASDRFRHRLCSGHGYAMNLV